MRNGSILLLAIFLFCSCNGDRLDRKEHPIYFELPAFFKKEAKRLTIAQPMVEKTVSINGSKEQKKLKVDWDREFGEFIEADINKASWSGMFAFSASDTSETYISQSDKIPVKQLEIKKNGNRIRSIKLIIINDNDLYRSHDTLSYYPDTLYHIIKSQKIKLMEQKRFEVVGRF